MSGWRPVSETGRVYVIVYIKCRSTALILEWMLIRRAIAASVGRAPCRVARSKNLSATPLITASDVAAAVPCVAQTPQLIAAWLARAACALEARANCGRYNSSSPVGRCRRHCFSRRRVADMSTSFSTSCVDVTYSVNPQLYHPHHQQQQHYVTMTSGILQHGVTSSHNVVNSSQSHVTFPTDVNNNKQLEVLIVTVI